MRISRMSEFKIPQISPLIGSTLSNYFKIMHGRKVEPAYYLKVFLTTLIVLIATPFHWWERYFFRKRIAETQITKSPLFIIGHWRSGTTLLHNLLCADPNAAYVTTYQSVFPNNLKSKWLFRSFMKMNMPEKRPSDNMELNIDFPQEDEYALSNILPNSYYNFFYFPYLAGMYYERSVYHSGLSKKDTMDWYERFDALCKKAMLNTGGEQLILKNPVNTARIKHLLKLYPDAKFLYIYRNPVIVFLSTQRFFQKLLPTLWFRKSDFGTIDRVIFNTYKKLMSDYQEQKSLIPPENLFELRFEDFEADPLAHLEKIYSDLLADDFKSRKALFKKQVGELRTYQKNTYTIDRDLLDRIVEEWKPFMDLYAYSIPEELNVLND